MKNLRHLRERLGSPNMLRSGPEVAARGPARRGPRKFFIQKALRGLRPQREWSLPTLRLSDGRLLGNPVGCPEPQREWSLPTLRHLFLLYLDGGAEEAAA